VRLGNRPGFGRNGGVCPPLLLIAAAGILAVWLTPGGAQPRDTGEPRNGAAVYRRPLGNDPVTLDPARASDIYSRSVSQQIFDGLVQFDQTLTITPALAQFWKASRDGLTWTFQLRKGVKFHHGREVTAEDVVYSLTRLLDPAVKSGAADAFTHIKGAPEFRDGRAKSVAGLVAVNRHTVQIELTEAPVPLVSVLAVGHAKIVPKEIVELTGEAFGSQPVGTGPFRFLRWERGKEIVLAANPDYFGGVPKLSRIAYRIFPGDQVDTMYNELRKGNLEDTPVPTRNYRRVIADPGHVYVKRPMFSLRHYGFNTRVKPFDDRRVRQALIYAIDRQALVEEAFLGRYTPARGILPPGTQGFNPSLRGYLHDPARARELLAQAGYPGGRGLPSVVIWSGAKHDAILREHEMIRRSLESVGVHVEFEYLTDWPAFSRMLDERKMPVFLHAWFADVPDPDNFLFKLFHSKSPRNFFNYANPIVDDLLAQARGAADPQKRVELYRQAEQLIVSDAPTIPVWHYTYERLFQPYVKSVEVSGLGDPYIPLRKVWLEGRR
jgi:oligopeptide transport system substrate-binding protein